nr:hypothetical protein BaRGS_006116 [Batillaria attramentaria]
MRGWCSIEDNLFARFDGPDHCLSAVEFEEFWYTFDLDGDGDISELEFFTTWRNRHFHDPQHAPFFFVELDRQADEVLNSGDFDHMFRLFDSNRDGCITQTEFSREWDALFSNIGEEN